VHASVGNATSSTWPGSVDRPVSETAPTGQLGRQTLTIMVAVTVLHRYRTRIPSARGDHGGVGSTVNPVTTVLLTAILLFAVMFVLVTASLALSAHAHHRRRLDDTRAQARRWVERLGGELLVLDGAAVHAGAVGLPGWPKLPSALPPPVPN
jgi:hypothetical protein